MTNRKQFDIIAKESLRGYGSVGRAMRSQRIGQGFESPYLHQIKDTAQGVLCFGGDNAGQHTARFTAQGAQVCKANLMSRIKVFASIFCLHPYPLSDRRLSYERMIPLSPPSNSPADWLGFCLVGGGQGMRTMRANVCSLCDKSFAMLFYPFGQFLNARRFGGLHRKTLSPFPTVRDVMQRSPKHYPFNALHLWRTSTSSRTNTKITTNLCRSPTLFTTNFFSPPLIMFSPPP